MFYIFIIVSLITAVIVINLILWLAGWLFTKMIQLMID